MAFAGMHVVFGYVAAAPKGSPALIKPVSSETVAAAGTTAISAPGNGNFGAPVAMLRAAADSYAAAAAAPNASTGTRIFVPAGETVVMYVESGDKIAWIAA